MPAALRTAKYSNLSDIWYRSAARWPDQWLQSWVWLSAAVRSWNGVVRIMPWWPSRSVGCVPTSTSPSGRP